MTSMGFCGATCLYLSHEQDKHEPNDYRTAKRVVESIEDALTEEDIAARCCQSKWFPDDLSVGFRSVTK